MAECFKTKTPGALRPPGVISLIPISCEMPVSAVMANSIARQNVPFSVIPIRLKVETVAQLPGKLARIVPVGSPESVGIVDEVARIADVLRGKA
jgi:hypothetical protein